ncbi:hypothetical protein A2397_01565 [Candidatus Amesbacteria bacterium RIFOXYB1_FULL_44_23]|uniref:Uncharacterized protein n=1 Tax=Candidatus Amesbacteria bacterium RIFOXYB1_FULL_44_23 TaxID=1797263 RepID=A0A1F4ZTI3_9BACT|nr:MAG: hypothetical protein A2397_01565 [Candidatus Amesbacteria bacterium RIFOXYB1_FULL_44_23]
MAVPLPTEYEYRPNLGEKILTYVKKTAPGVLARAIQITMHAIFEVARFIIQMFKDATTR